MAERYKLGDIDNERFYQVPKSLFINPKYKSMSNTSKMMYAILKDRMELSRKNGWHDENNDIFLLFDQQDMADLLGTSRVTINRYMKELKVARLIEPIRQGLGKPNKIYINKPQPYSSEHQDVSGVQHQDVSDLLHQNVSEFNSSDTEGSDTERERHKEDDDDRDKGWQDVLKAYQNNINPVMGEWELEKLQDLFDDFKETWVTEAIKEAVEHNARSLRYITVTLEQWQRDGFKVDKRKKPQSSKRKANSYSQDDYEKVLAELERKDSNAREG